MYKDNFKDSLANYLEQTGQVDSDGNKLSVNTDTSGRYHTDWLNMMYPRLKLARNLLTDDGVIFISIDDNEVANLRKIADLVFGENCFVTKFIWTKTSTPPSLSNKTRKTVEYVLAYEKSANNSRYFGSFLENGDAPLLNSGNPVKELLIPSNKLKINFLENGIVSSGMYERTSVVSDFSVKDGWNSTPVIVKGEFKWTQEKLNDEIKQGTLLIAKTKKFSLRFQRVDSNAFKTPNNFLNREINKEHANVLTNEMAVSELNNMGIGNYFDYPKPISLIQYLLNMKAHFDKDCTILDFFSGSSTTADAVMRLNAEDGGNRKFIMVQLPEQLSEKDVAYADGYRTIPEIAQERIRRAGDKIVDENPLFASKLDISFKVFELDKSNIKKWNVDSTNLIDQIEILQDNFETGSTPLDVVYEIMLKQGHSLTSHIVEENLDDSIVYTVEYGAMFIVLGNKINSSVANYIVDKIKELEIENSIVVFQDQQFESDSEKLNAIEILNENGVEYDNILSI